ncbi:orotidine-5'-phosphate decarboxylase [Schleiferiaceae bacterium]|nr:orotidine-5'-phosphate decarboxylase [Schleiferiaceae bacterium]
MTRTELASYIQAKKSVLCVGLDPDLDKMPAQFTRDAQGVADFCCAIIDATSDYAVAYKPNLAFFESLGLEGWAALAQVAQHLSKYPEHFSIADAKRGDIGNTARHYAEGILGQLGFDSITVAPYMGRDSLEPFALAGKWVIALGLTSNPGAQDFQMQAMADGRPLYAHVLDSYATWASPDQWMVVVGATRPEGLAAVRKQLPDHFFLVPGVGAQGGSVEDVMKAGAVPGEIALLINSSRGILYASSEADFAEAAAREAARLVQEMKQYWPS